MVILKNSQSLKFVNKKNFIYEWVYLVYSHFLIHALRKWPLFPKIKLLSTYTWEN